MATKTEQLQIRVTRRQKAAIKAMAARRGLDVSELVLARLIPREKERFQSLVKKLTRADELSYTLAEIHDLLATWSVSAFREGTEDIPSYGLSAYAANYLAAMVETKAEQGKIGAPAWVNEIEPLDVPHFATSLFGLRPYLLTRSPVPFRRRNIFVDATLGDRV